jgi:hypothetical protein
MNYSWIEINFYSFPFTPLDFKTARKGDKEGLDRKANEVASIPEPTTRDRLLSSSLSMRSDK